MKEVIKLSCCVAGLLSLCSFTAGVQSLSSDFHRQDGSFRNPFLTASGGGWYIGNENKTWVENGMIDRYVYWTMVDNAAYTEPHQGYKILTHGGFAVRGALSSVSYEIGYSSGTETSYYFEMSVGLTIGRAASAMFGVPGLAQVGGSISASFSAGLTFGCSYSFYQTVSSSVTYQFDLTPVPSNYQVAPCVLAKGRTLDISYYTVDNWWWGEPPAEGTEENPLRTQIAEVDTDSMVISYCVRADENSPIYYYMP